MEPERESNSPNPDETSRRPVRRVVRQRQPSSRARTERVEATPISPAPEVAPVVQEPEDTGPRLCPFCHQEVSAQAVVCRHCGRDLVAANGVRLVLPKESWNTNVPPWMLEQEQRYLKRRDYVRLARAWWPKVVIGVIMVVLLAILFRLLTAPPPPDNQVGVTGVLRDERGVSSLDMDSADQARKPKPAPVASASTRATTPTVVSTPTPQSAPDVVETMEAKELVRRFALDHAYADDKYKDQILRLTGNVKSVDTAAGTPYLLLDVPSDIEVRCYLSPSALVQLARIRAGTQVTIQGRCLGWFNNITLSDCELR